MFAFRLISYLPFWCLYLLSDILYIFAYYLVGYRKELIERNIRHAFPEKTPQERKKIKKQFYRNFTDSFAETIKLLTLKEEKLKKRFVIKNGEEIIKKLQKGGILLGLTSHFFNWEALPLAFKVAVDPRCETVYLKVNNPFFEKLMRKIRKRFGGYLVERANFQRNFIKHRNTTRLIGLAADQRPSRQETRYWATFMNRETSFFEGPEKLAKRFNLPLFFSKVQKPKRGHYIYTLQFIGQGPYPEKDHSITDLYIQLVEKNIREEPALYLWSHNRWKNSP